MGHHITIDSDEAFSLATELTALTGETMDVAVVTALRNRLSSEKTQQAKLARILAIAAEFRASLGGDIPLPSTDWLYDDDTGLPA